MGVTALSPCRGKALVSFFYVEGLLRDQYGGKLGSVGNGIDLFVAGALSAVSCALSFLFRCYIEVFRSWLISPGAAHVFVVHRRHC